MASLHLHFVSESACYFVRMLQPARFCYEELKQWGHTIEIGDTLPSGFDWIGFHGLPSYLQLFRLQELQNEGSKILWSLDDDFLSIPDWNPAKLGPEGLACFSFMRSMADHIFVSTKAIANTFNRYDPVDDRTHEFPLVSVAPNLLDLGQFPTPPYEEFGFAENWTPELPVRVVWMGGPTHKEDVSFLTPVIRELLKKHGKDRVWFVFMGQAPPSELIREFLHRGVFWQQGVTFSQYAKIRNSINPHIWLAPLADIPFNLSKSNLRILEGWALSSAVVASDWGEYSCIRHGIDGMLCKTEEDWFDHLNALILDPNRRLQMAADGWQRVKAEWNWANRDNRFPWIAALGRLFGESFR